MVVAERLRQEHYRPVERVRVGRNFLRLGDAVRVRPSRKGRHDGFAARVADLQLLRGHPDDEAVGNPRYAQVTVVHPANAASRTFFLDRIERKAKR